MLVCSEHEPEISFVQVDHVVLHLGELLALVGGLALLERPDPALVVVRIHAQLPRPPLPGSPQDGLTLVKVRSAAPGWRCLRIRRVITLTARQLNLLILHVNE